MYFMKTTLLLSIIGLIIFSSWTRQTNDTVLAAEWLVGTWENKTTKGSTYETWTKSAQGELLGKSYMLKAADTVVFETIRLVAENGKLLYIPTVKNQNNALPVRFVSVKITPTTLVFENVNHDFPQKITYNQITTDSLVAEISGLKNGTPRSVTFPMKRVK